MKEEILVITGPTASGKTALGIEMALRLRGEIVSADSMQIYKGMDVATAKPTNEEMSRVPHHLIGFLERTESFSVADYVAKANEVIEDILSRGKKPIVVGGTGLYITSLINNVIFADIKSDESVRERLRAQAAEYGNEFLLRKLEECDPVTASELHENNLTRVIRALEVYELTGKKLSDYRNESLSVPSPYSFTVVALTYKDRQYLYNRINKRVDFMVKNGLIDEAYEIYKESGKIKTAHQAIGCKELIPYFEKKSTLDECIDKIKQETRRYAKRQLTWFRNKPDINWIEADENPDINFFIKKCEKIIAKQKNV